MVSRNSNFRTSFRCGSYALCALLVFTVFAAGSFNEVYGKTKKAKYGTIKIHSTPGGLPLTVDGTPYGQTTTVDRSIDLEPGLHTLIVFLPDGQRWTREIDLPAGRVKCIVLNYRPGPLRPPKSPCPFPVNISAPAQVTEGEIITYTSDVNYGGTSGLVYSWTLTPGNARILSGAGTPTITVDSTGIAGERVVAKLVVNDGSSDPTCTQIAEAATIVRAQPKRTLVGREFDTCCSCSFDDQKARLDNLAVELQNDPTTTTYVFGYAGRRSNAGQANKLLTRARDYLVSQRGIDQSRIVIVNGGYREEDCVELWVVPRGAELPRPRPTVQPSEVRPALESRPRRHGRG